MEKHKNKLILVIDDEPDLREMIQYQLQKSGFEVHTAINGADALKKLESLNPHLIILDMNMPEMGGKEFFKKICNDNNTPKYPILVLTAAVSIESLFQDFNVNGYVAKPFTIEEFMRAVKVILDSESEA